MSDHFEEARALFSAGLRCHEAGDLEGAVRAFEQAQALAPGRPSVLLNLAHALVDLQRPQEALSRLEALLAQEPHHLEALYRQGLLLRSLGRLDEATEAFRALAAADPQAAEPWWQIGQLQQALERDEEALASYVEVLARDPARADAWSCRGELLKDQGRFDEAAQSFGEAIARGGDAALNAYLLASVTGQAAPPQAPAAYVRRLFDPYAEDFDAHLVHGLHYRAPQLLAEHLQQVAPGRRYAAALDLGCGTGLCAPLLKPSCNALDGVDLSAPMLERARSLGLYRCLVQADVASHLAHTETHYELLIAADVFIYIGALDAVFAGAARVLDRGGIFAFSAEAAPDDADFRLLPSARYAHSLRYLQALAAAHGFDPGQVVEATLRHEQQQPLRGYIVILRRR